VATVRWPREPPRRSGRPYRTRRARALLRRHRGRAPSSDTRPPVLGARPRAAGADGPHRLRRRRPNRGRLDRPARGESVNRDGVDDLPVRRVRLAGAGGPPAVATLGS